MRRQISHLLALMLALALFAAPAAAQTVVPSTFMGINYGYDPAVAKYPNFAAQGRIWDSSNGATYHAGMWNVLNPSSGVFTFSTNLDPQLNTLAAAHIPATFTLGNVPSWVNSVQAVASSGQLASLGAYVTALMSHVAANGQCFGFFEDWNEANNGSSWWTGTDSYAAQISATAYPIVKAACPKTVVYSPSITVTGDASVTNVPNSAFEHMYGILSACAAAGPCFDQVAIHSYPPTVGPSSLAAGVRFAAELTAGTLTNARAVMSATGFGSYPLAVTEGYTGDPTNVVVANSDSAAWAAAQVANILILASGRVQAFDYFDIGSGCALFNCGSVYNPNGVMGMTMTGMALRTATSWLAGATFPNGVVARTQGTNLIAGTMNGAGIATGKLAGPGGCSGAPSGTGSLPTPMYGSYTAPAAGGLSYYLNADGTDSTSGMAYLDLRVCGADATSGNGVNIASIVLDNPGEAVSFGQQVTVTICWQLVGGSLANISEIDFGVNEYNSSNAGLGTYSIDGNFIPVSGVNIGSQCYQYRYTPVSASVAYVRPNVTIRNFYNSTTAQPIDMTLRLAGMRVEVGANQWTGVITKSGGYQATAAWDASGGPSAFTVPTGAAQVRDIFNNVTAVTAGSTYSLSGSPVLFENKTWLH